MKDTFESTPPVEEEPVENERKFLVRQLPDNLNQYPSAEVLQGYLRVDADGSENRLRRKTKNGKTTYIRTTKQPATAGGQKRLEDEHEIGELEFHKLWFAVIGQPVEKRRYEIPHGIQTIELDIYSGHLQGLVVAEVEFTSDEAAAGFKPPEWFGPEVTDDQRYKNQSLATNGLPD